MRPLFGTRGLTQEAARAAGWRPPPITDPLQLAAMRANPNNPWMVGPQQRALLDQQRMAWDSQFGSGGQTGRMTFGQNPVTVDSYKSDWGRGIENGIAARMSAIPMSQGGWAEPQGTGIGGGLFGPLLSAAIGLATGNPWLAAALRGGQGAASGGLRGAVTGAAGSFLPGPTDVLSRLSRIG